LNQLEDGEFFNIVSFDSAVKVMSEEPLEKNTEETLEAIDFVKHLEARGKYLKCYKNICRKIHDKIF
jgi:hypothetical protein